MALPENEVATFEIGWLGVVSRAQGALLHIAVARAADAASRERDLDETGTVEPETALAAPEIGNVDESLRDRHEVALVEIERRQVSRRDIAVHRHGKWAIKVCDG